MVFWKKSSKQEESVRQSVSTISDVDGSAAIEVPVEHEEEMETPSRIEDRVTLADLSVVVDEAHKDESHQESQCPSIAIENGLKVRGTLYFDRDLSIEGELEGDIISSASVLVAEGARVKGTIHATDIKIAGVVDGELVAKNLTEISESADCKTRIETKRLSVQPGCSIQGECRMPE